MFPQSYFVSCACSLAVLVLDSVTEINPTAKESTHLTWTYALRVGTFFCGWVYVCKYVVYANNTKTSDGEHDGSKTKKNAG